MTYIVLEKKQIPKYCTLCEALFWIEFEIFPCFLGLFLDSLRKRIEASPNEKESCQLFLFSTQAAVLEMLCMQVFVANNYEKLGNEEEIPFLYIQERKEIFKRLKSAWNKLINLLKEGQIQAWENVFSEKEQIKTQIEINDLIKSDLEKQEIAYCGLKHSSNEISKEEWRNRDKSASFLFNSLRTKEKVYNNIVILTEDLFKRFSISKTETNNVRIKKVHIPVFSHIFFMEEKENKLGRPKKPSTDFLYQSIFDDIEKGSLPIEHGSFKNYSFEKIMLCKDHFDEIISEAQVRRIRDEIKASLIDEKIKTQKSI